MDILHIIEIIIVVICAITYGLMLYFKVKGNITVAVSEFIALAEQTDMCGAEKMAQVVACLYDKVPKFFKRFLSEEKLEEIAQHIFDWMRKYADEYIKKNEETCSGERTYSNSELAARFSTLMKQKLPELKLIAAEYGLEVAENATREEIIRVVITHCLDQA